MDDKTVRSGLTREEKKRKVKRMAGKQCAFKVGAGAAQEIGITRQQRIMGLGKEPNRMAIACQQQARTKSMDPSSKVVGVRRALGSKFRRAWPSVGLPV